MAKLSNNTITRILALVQSKEPLKNKDPSWYPSITTSPYRTSDDHSFSALCSVSTVLSFGECCKNGTIQPLTFWDFSFTRHNSWIFMQVGACVNVYSILQLSCIPWYGCTTGYLTIHPPKGSWVVSQFGAITSKTTMNICIQVFVWKQVFICLE